MAADNLVEIRIWSVPASHKRPHGYKYSLVYIKSGNRIVGYDNAEGKGDTDIMETKRSHMGFRVSRNFLKIFIMM